MIASFESAIPPPSCCLDRLIIRSAVGCGVLMLELELEISIAKLLRAGCLTWLPLADYIGEGRLMAT